jgi:hypothetical protein
MKQQTALYWLVPLLIVLTIAAAGIGLFQKSEGTSVSFTTRYGEEVQLYGQGLYKYDTVFGATASRGTDVVTLFVALPLLVVSGLLYQRASLRGGLMLLSVLAYLLYYAAARGLGTAYNSLFLVYIALFSTSFFSFVLAFTAINLQTLPTHISPRLPRVGMAIFMFVAGLGTAFIWLSDAVNALTTNQIPAALGPDTTVVTYTIDVGIIAPTALLAGILLLRRAPLGYLLTAILTTMLAEIGIMVIWQTIMQVNAGIQFSTGELIGKVGSWIIMGGFAVWLTILFLRNVSNSTEPYEIKK